MNNAEIRVSYWNGRITTLILNAYDLTPTQINTIKSFVLEPWGDGCFPTIECIQEAADKAVKKDSKREDIWWNNAIGMDSSILEVILSYNNVSQTFFSVLSADGTALKAEEFLHENEIPKSYLKSYYTYRQHQDNTTLGDILGSIY